MKIRNSLILCLTLISSMSTAYAENNDREGLPSGHISAWGSTLDEMTEGLRVASMKAGAKKFKITSAHVGNRYYGTAAIYD